MQEACGLSRHLPTLAATFLLAVALAAPAHAVTLTEHAAGLALGERPSAAAPGPNGHVYVTEENSNRLFNVLSPSGDLVGAYPFPVANIAATDVVAGPDGNLWVTGYNDRIVRMGPTGAGAVAFTVPGAGSGPSGIVAGSDGNLWFLERASGQIGRITPAGVITEFAFPTPSFGNGIGVGPDGNVWYTRSGGGYARITPAGVITEFPGPPGVELYDIAVLGGRMWITVSGNGVLPVNADGSPGAIVDTTSDDPVTTITAGTDGHLWLGHFNNKTIERVAPTGATKVFGPVGGTPNSMSTMSDGVMWSPLYNGSKLVRIVLDPPTAISGTATAVTTTGATLNGTVDPNDYVTEARFEYGATTAYGSSTPLTTTSDGADPVALSAALTGLAPDATYHYRVVATNAAGTAASADATFRTTAVVTPPAVVPAVAAKLQRRSRTRLGVTRISKLILTGLRTGDRVVVSCKGRGCPRKATLTSTGATLSLTAKVRRAKLRRKAVLTIAVTRTGAAGRSFRLTAGSRKLTLKTRSIPAG